MVPPTLHLAHSGFMIAAMRGGAASAPRVSMRSCGRRLMCVLPISDHRHEPLISDKQLNGSPSVSVCQR
jgi:hypothetical protein